MARPIGMPAVLLVPVLVVVLTGCAPAARGPATTYSGLAGTVIALCLSGISGPGRSAAALARTSVQVSATRWTWTSSTVQVRGSADTPGAQLAFAPFEPTSTDTRVARALARCMIAHPLDWSLALDDSVATRLRLYPWYRDVLLPCLNAWDGARRALPSRVEFVEDRGDRFDPYGAVFASSFEDALGLQRRCPPAPPDLASEARLLVAVSG